MINARLQNKTFAKRKKSQKTRFSVESKEGLWNLATKLPPCQKLNDLFDSDILIAKAQCGNLRNFTSFS